ncbi:MAG: hypothetical protein RLZZ436_2309, partial [Planctomycetota bacterium]
AAHCSFHRVLTSHFSLLTSLSSPLSTLYSLAQRGGSPRLRFRHPGAPLLPAASSARSQGTLPAGFRPAAQSWRKLPVAIPAPWCPLLPAASSVRSQGTLPAGFRPAAHMWRKPPVAISAPWCPPLPAASAARSQGTLPAGFRPAAQAWRKPPVAIRRGGVNLLMWLQFNLNAI